MRIGLVIGDVTLSRQLDNFVGGRWLIVQPLPESTLRDSAASTATAASASRAADSSMAAGASPFLSEPVIAYDELSPGRGARVTISEGREAAMPFYPRPVPIDVYCAAVLDEVKVKSDR
ncbi:MAG: EutN/CcmL family microcompartment protein [Planctomycetota bacterium]